MSYNIKELLVLPAEEKIAIADLLYSSVNDDIGENETTTEWYNDPEFTSAIEKEFEEWRHGKAKGYTLDKVKNLMEEHKANYKRSE